MMVPYQCDWTGIRAKCQSIPWAADIHAAIRADFALWAEILDVPKWDKPTHRFHTYYCDADGHKLSWSSRKPHSHECAKCGKVYSGDPWDGAWRSQMHSAAAQQLERAAILMRLGDRHEIVLATDEFERILFFYSRHYPEYRIHGDRPGQEGRVMPHRLNEAVWLVSILRSLRWSGHFDRLGGERRREVRDMAQLAVDLLRPQIRAVHNHFTWLLAAIAECAVVLDDRELSDWCREHELGMHVQIDQGFNDDGFWYESSTAYQFYTLESVLSYCEATGSRGVLGNERRRKLILAVNNPPLLAYGDGTMPAYADGWLDTSLLGFAHIAERAYGLWGDEIKLSPYYRNESPLRVRTTGGAPAPEIGDTKVSARASVSALLHGPAKVEPAHIVRRDLVIFPSAGVAILKNEKVRLGIRYGQDGGFHDHRDKLNVDIESIGGWRSLDLGTSGYSSAFVEWQRSPFCHNLIVIDGERQVAHAGRLVESSCSSISTESSYDGVKFSRSIHLFEDGWLDDYSVSLDRRRRIEWFFHGDGFFESEKGGQQAAGFGGCPWFTNVRRLNVTGRLVGSWLSDNSTVRVELPIPSDFTVFSAEAPGNAGGRPLGVVIVQGEAFSARFSGRFYPSASGFDEG